MSKIVRNQTEENVRIQDLSEFEIVKSESINLEEYFTNDRISKSEDLFKLIANEKLIPNDGTRDLTITEAISHFMGYYQKLNVEKDGKLITKASPRPIGLYTYFTGARDFSAEEIGDGKQLYIKNQVGTSKKSVDLNIYENSFWYIKEGYLFWRNAGISDSNIMDCIDFEVWCTGNILEDGTDYTIELDKRVKYTPGEGNKNLLTSYITPNKNNKGFWNLDGEKIIPCENETGNFDIYSIDTKLLRFANKLTVCGTNYSPSRIVSEDTEKMLPGYYLKLTSYNNSNTEWDVWAWITLYRKTTI